MLVLKTISGFIIDGSNLKVPTQFEWNGIKNNLRNLIISKAESKSEKRDEKKVNRMENGMSSENVRTFDEF